MNEAKKIAIHINMLEDSLYHLHTFAHALKEHNNHKAAAVFSDAENTIKKEITELKNKYKETDLPKIAPWEKPSPAYSHPSSLLMDAHYQISEAEAKAIVEKMNQNHEDSLKHYSG